MAKKYRHLLMGGLTIIASLIAFFSNLFDTKTPEVVGGQGTNISTAIGTSAAATRDGVVAGPGAVAVGPGASGNISVINGNFSIFPQNKCEKIVAWERCVVPVVDKNGLTGKLITVISRDMAWKKGSAETFEYRSGAKADFVQHIRSETIESQIKQFRTIITVGAASHEITSNADPIRIENDRAYGRATHLQRLVKENIATQAELYVLAIGKNSKAVDDSSDQRLVVILGVVEAAPGFDIESMLKGELGNVKPFPFKLSEYSDFRLEQFR